ncbi:endoglucanase 16, partial [Tanacetum coccineum]
SHKDGHGGTWFQLTHRFITTCSYPTDKDKDIMKAQVNLVGGYYDAGDNVKYGFPMAFTVTTLAWAAYFYKAELTAAGEMNNVLDGIRWGTDYFLKASTQRNRLFVQVGDPVKDHECWMRPENMKSSRKVLEINQNCPGTEIAAETAAALAASSLVFHDVDQAYARSLLNGAKKLFQFANEHRGTFDGECPFYCSFSGYHDELLWGATWLYIATKRPIYLKYIQEESTTAIVSEFSWDLKFAGAQVLLSQLYWEGEKELQTFQQQADGYICSVLPESPYHQAFMTPGGLIHLRVVQMHSMVTSTAFLISVYSEFIGRHNMQSLGGDNVSPMDYLLGDNPLKRSMMVGFGNNPPVQAHHRGASVPVMATNEEINCGMSFVYWYNTDKPNPNELTGAILGGPDKQDRFVDSRVDLVGGYYDAGDNVKYGFPMAFTVTTMAWAAYFYEPELTEAGELNNLLAGIRWGTDYFLKASCQENRLFVQVGDPNEDHKCWMKPEGMKTPRTVLEINQNRPGTEVAAETAAALAASSIVFSNVDKPYSEQLLDAAKKLFQFAEDYKGTFDGACPFYCSYSGYNDELLWGAAWLYVATKDPQYLQYIVEESTSAVVYEFSWDLKYAGVQVLLSQLYWEGQKELESFQRQADEYICSVIPDSPYRQPFMTPGGLIHFRDGANSQYVTSTAFLFSVYSDLLARHNMQVTCGDKTFTHINIMDFAKQEMDYLLGNNPANRSIMVGFGHNPPLHAHHRGASIPLTAATEEVNCGMSFVYWFNTDAPNPNELTGAILGGPNREDVFIDSRMNSSCTEPCTYINSLAIGVLAKLAKHHAAAK